MSRPSSRGCERHIHDKLVSTINCLDRVGPSREEKIEGVNLTVFANGLTLSRAFLSCKDARLSGVAANVSCLSNRAGTHFKYANLGWTKRRGLISLQGSLWCPGRASGRPTHSAIMVRSSSESR